MTQVPSPGAKNISTLTGSEKVGILAGSISVQTTTAAIAALAASDSPFVSTSITTVGNGTLTAAGLLGDVILRSGPVAAFSDATDTAAAIIAAFPSGAVVGVANDVNIKNATAFPMTITAGTGVTLPPTVVIPPWSVGEYAVQITSATAVTFVHIGTNPLATGASLTAPALTALTTVGAGTVLAAAFANGFVLRTGIQVAAFTDTTDTGTAIVAACPQLVGPKLGSAFVFRYVNSTSGAGGFPATITGGTGVTVSGITVVPAQSWADFLVTQTAANTLTMVGMAQGFLSHAGTAVANGATPVAVTDANVTPGSTIVVTLKTAGGTAHGAFVSASTPGTGFSINSLAGDTATYNYTILG